MCAFDDIRDAIVKPEISIESMHALLNTISSLMDSELHRNNIESRPRWYRRHARHAQHEESTAVISRASSTPTTSEDDADAQLPVLFDSNNGRIRIGSIFGGLLLPK
jgi:hypothetical protein